jgi:hypothetical protein
LIKSYAFILNRLFEDADLLKDLQKCHKTTYAVAMRGVKEINEKNKENIAKKARIEICIDIVLSFF